MFLWKMNASYENIYLHLEDLADWMSPSKRNNQIIIYQSSNTHLNFKILIDLMPICKVILIHDER